MPNRLSLWTKRIVFVLAFVDTMGFAASEVVHQETSSILEPGKNVPAGISSPINETIPGTCSDSGRGR